MLAGLDSGYRRLGYGRLAIPCAAVLLLYSIWPVLAAQLRLLYFTLAGTSDDITATLFIGLLRVFGRASLIACVGVILAVITAFAIRRSPRSLALVLVIGLLAPFFVSPPLRAFAWSRLLAADGLVSSLCALTTNGSIGDVSLRHTALAASCVILLNILPFGVLAVLPFVPSARHTPWLVSRELDGTIYAAFVRGVVPQAIPGIVLAFCWMLVLAMFASDEIQYLDDGSLYLRNLISAALTRGSESASRGNKCWTEFYFLCTACFGGLAATTGIAALAQIKWHAVARWLTRRTAWLARGRGSGAGHRDTGTRGVADFVFVVATHVLAWMVVLCSVVPVLWLIVRTFAVWPPAQGDSLALSLTNWREFAQSPVLREAVWASVGIGAILGLISVVIAVVVGCIWLFSRRIAIALCVLLWVGAMFPGDAYVQIVLQTIGSSLTGGWVAIVAMQIPWVAPFAASVIVVRMWFLSDTALQAACEFDPSTFRIWRRIILPQVWRTLVAVFTFGFLLSLNDVVRCDWARGSLELLGNRVYGALNTSLTAGGGRVLAAAGFVALITVLASGGALALVLVHRAVAVSRR